MPSFIVTISTFNTIFHTDVAGLILVLAALQLNLHFVCYHYIIIAVRPPSSISPPVRFSSFHSFFQVVVAPPLFRTQPHWYSRHLSQVASRFSASMSSIKVNNLFLLPSFCSQDLMPDGAFLTPVSGLHYILHVFDQTHAVLETASLIPDQQLGQVQEVVRRHDDRLAYLEGQQNHQRDTSELRYAASCEYNDYVMNQSEEDWMTILGLKRLSTELDNRAWQIAVKKQVNDVIKLVLNVQRASLDYSILYVHNPIRGRTTGQTVLNVQLNSVGAAKRFREMYSGFFRRERPFKLPPVLKGVSVRNKVTLETRIRIAIMQQLASNYKASNPNSSVQVQGYSPRPRLSTIPARGSSDRPRSYNFIQAVSTLPATFSDDSLVRIYQVVGNHRPGELRSLFVVLNDDDRDRCLDLVRAGHRQVQVPPSSGLVASGSTSGPGAGMDLMSGFLASLRSPPPPPPSSPTSSSVSDRRTLKSGTKIRASPSPQDDRRGPKRHLSSSDSDSSPNPRSKSKDEHQKRSTKRTRRHSSSSSSGGSSSAPAPAKSSKSKSRNRRRSRSRSGSNSSSAPAKPTKSKPAKIKSKSKGSR